MSRRNRDHSLHFPPEQTKILKRLMRELPLAHEARERFRNQSDSRRFPHLPKADNPEPGKLFQSGFNKVCLSKLWLGGPRGFRSCNPLSTAASAEPCAAVQ